MGNTNLIGITMKRKCLPPNTTCAGIAIKCYEEQLIGGWEGLSKRIKEIPLEEYEVMEICHDRDPASDGWEDAKLKRHFHIIMRIRNAKRKAERQKVKKLLSLLGVHYDMEKDKTLYENHGVENIGDWNVYALYLTHDTPQAIKDGKVHYSPRKIVSNLSRTAVEKMQGKANQLKKPTGTDPVELIEEVKKLVAERKDFTPWLAEQPYATQKDRSLVQVLQSNYDAEIERKYGKGTGKDTIAIFIGGKGNTGKTTSSIEGCKALGMKLYEAPSGTGKWDGLSISYDAILIDDSTPKNELLGLIQDRVIKFHRRNSNDRYFTGSLIIVTSNDDFREFARKCGYPEMIPVRDGTGNPVTYKNEEGKTETKLKWNPQYEAFASRFFICEVAPLDKESDTSRYYLKQVQNDYGRGNESGWKKKRKMFQIFLKAFNNCIVQYQQADYIVDQGSENEKEKKRLLKALAKAQPAT